MQRSLCSHLLLLVRCLFPAWCMAQSSLAFTVVFWALLSTGALRTEFSTWSNISEHALNSVIAFLEVILPRSEPHPWVQIVPLIIVLALYLGLAYLTHDTEHFYVYDFLDP